MEKDCSNELTKDDSKALKGIAILFMLSLHLFCRRENLPYTTNLYIGEVPFVYYLGLWGDQCVSLFSFCAGYASYMQQEKMRRKEYIRYSIKRVSKLLLNYWIIMLFFSVIGILVGKATLLPGSFLKFLSNFFLLSSSYNGAWWFLLIYILLVASSPIVYQITKRHKYAIVFLVTGIIYFISYLVRFGIWTLPDSGKVFNWSITQLALLGTSLFPYIVGMLFYRNLVVTKIRKVGMEFSKVSIVIVTIISFLFCIITHSIEESLIIAPIYAVITVGVVCLWSGKIIIFLEKIGKHSTNIWLTHMFFYMVLFDGFIFRFKYPILIYVMMLVMNLGVSHIINFILAKVISYIKVLNL